MICPHCGCEIQIPEKDTDTSDDFAVFWDLYPKHKAKADAEKAWRQTLKVRPKLGVLLDAIEAQKLTRDWQKDGGAYVPLPASWLRGKRWLDEVQADAVTPRITETIRQQARDIRARAYGGCPHDPRCETYAACVEVIAMELVTKERV